MQTIYYIPILFYRLFGETADNAKKTKAMKKKTKKKSEPKDYSMFDTESDAPSIFDDPLNPDKQLILYHLICYHKLLRDSNFVRRYVATYIGT